VSAPTSITGSPLELLPTAAYTGFRYLVNSSGTMTPSVGDISGDCVTNGSLTLNCSGGASSGHVVLNNQANTFTTAGALSLASSTVGGAFLLPSGSGSNCAASSGNNGCVAYDSSGNRIYVTINSALNYLAAMSTGTSPTIGTVPKFNSSTWPLLTNSSIGDGGSGVTIGSPTGSAEGAGTLNATGLFVNGVAVQTSTTMPINNVVSATGAITEIQDGNNALLISSAQTTASQVAVGLSEHTAATSTGTPYQVEIKTLAGSTSTPLHLVQSLTGSQTLPIETLNPTWNSSGVVQGLLFNVTCTAAATGSTPLLVQLAGAEQTSLKYGAANCASPEWIIPNGTAALPGLAFEGATTSGFYYTGSGSVPAVATNGAASFAFTGGGQVTSSGLFKWSSNGTITTAADTGLSRDSVAAVVAVGSGAQGSEAGFLRDAKPCRITAAVTLTTTTTICTWTLPAAAIPWGYQCMGMYQTNTSSITLLLGTQFANAPTVSTHEAIIWSAASTQTYGAASNTGTTAVTTMTGVAPASGAATPWHASGTFTANASGGTFVIYGTASTSSDAQINAGSICSLY